MTASLNRAFFTVGVALLLPRVGMSQSREQECDGAGTQSAITACADSASRAASRRLDALLGELRARLEAPRRARLASVQRRWARYRDAHCAWDAEVVEGGSLQPTWIARCREALTLDRIAVLRLQLCEGGGMKGTCPAAERYAPSAGRPGQDGAAHGGRATPPSVRRQARTWSPLDEERHRSRGVGGTTAAHLRAVRRGSRPDR